MYKHYLTIQGKVYYGILHRNNPDLYQYRGYGLVVLNYRSKKDKFWATLIVNPTSNIRRINTTLELNYKPKHEYNQHLFLQWYNGYAEQLINYKVYTSMIRVGLCIKPNMISFY